MRSMCPARERSRRRSPHSSNPRDFEDAIRKAVSLGGDSDTLACITGGIAHAFYGPLPEHITRRVYSILDDRLGEVTREFMNAFVEANSN